SPPASSSASSSARAERSNGHFSGRRPVFGGRGPVFGRRILSAGERRPLPVMERLSSRSGEAAPRLGAGAVPVGGRPIEAGLQRGDLGGAEVGVAPAFRIVDELVGAVRVHARLLLV